MLLRCVKPQSGRGNPRKRTDRIVRGGPKLAVVRANGEAITFRELALMAWPQKAEAHLSYLTGYDKRTCRRWLAGETGPPADALGVVMQEILRCFHMR